MPEVRGFTQVPNWLIMSKAVNATAKMVYLVLASHANAEGECFPGHETIAREAGCSADTVQRALVALRGVGAVAWRRTGGSNRYRIAVGNRGPVAASVRPDTADLRERDAADLRHEQDLGEQDPEEQDTPPPSGVGADDGLFAARLTVVPDSGPPKTAQTLVARWCEGYQSQHGASAPGPVMRRVAGQAKNLARSCETDADWAAAWRAALAAGEHGRVDPVPFMVKVKSQFAPRGNPWGSASAASQ